MMTKQARSSAVIMGFDTHMILETVPVHLQLIYFDLKNPLGGA